MNQKIILFIVLLTLTNLVNAQKDYGTTPDSFSSSCSVLIFILWAIITILILLFAVVLSKDSGKQKRLASDNVAFRSFLRPNKTSIIAFAILFLYSFSIILLLTLADMTLIESLSGTLFFPFEILLLVIFTLLDILFNLFGVNFMRIYATHPSYAIAVILILLIIYMYLLSCILVYLFRKMRYLLGAEGIQSLFLILLLIGIVGSVDSISSCVIYEFGSGCELGDGPRPDCNPLTLCDCVVPAFYFYCPDALFRYSRLALSVVSSILVIIGLLGLIYGRHKTPPHSFSGTP